MLRPYWRTPDDLEYEYTKTIPQYWFEAVESCQFFDLEKDCSLIKMLDILLRRFPRGGSHHDYLHAKISRNERCYRALNVAGYRLSLYEDNDPDLMTSLDTVLKAESKEWRRLYDFKQSAIFCSANEGRGLGSGFFTSEGIMDVEYLHQLTLEHGTIFDPYDPLKP